MRVCVGTATQALLKCWCVHTGIASVYCSVAMVKTYTNLYLVKRKGKVRGYRLFLGGTYHSFHATMVAGLKARPAKLAKASKASLDSCTPPSA